MKQKVLNFYGGPGSGKSTLAAFVFADLKLQGYNVELVREYAKEWAWRGIGIKPEHQRHVFNEQYDRMRILKGQVELIITDSPLMLSTVYGTDYDLAKNCYNEYDNLDLFVERTKHYNPNGRFQTEAEAIALDEQFLKFTNLSVSGDHTGAEVACYLARDFIHYGD